MAATIHDTWDRRDLLPEIQGLLEEAESALLCVAFVSPAGVQLLEPQLRRLGRSCGLVATTQFSATSPGLRLAAAFGTDVRVLDPAGSSTYHPKIYLAEHGGAQAALVGSANLTAGLIGNVEVGVLSRGDAVAARAWELGRGLWSRAVPLAASPDALEPVRSPMPPELLDLFQRSVRPGAVVRTLARGAENVVIGVHAHGIEVATARSQARGARELVPARMFEIAWSALRARGALTNAELLHELHVHRSSFVCALLAQVPGVVVRSRDPIELAWAPASAA